MTPRVRSDAGRSCVRGGVGSIGDAACFLVGLPASVGTWAGVRLTQGNVPLFRRSVWKSGPACRIPPLCHDAPCPPVHMEQSVFVDIWHILTDGRCLAVLLRDTVPLQTVYPVGKLSTMSGNGAATCFSTLSTVFSTSVPTKTSRFHILFHTGVENVVEKSVHTLYERRHGRPSL